MSKIFRKLPSATAEAYAAEATSKKLLTEEQNRILRLAARGQEVDVVEFRKAATAALSAASTRAGASIDRRTYAKEARHLIYWADAIIEAALDELPAFEPGERSRKVEELSAEVVRLRHLIDEQSASVSGAQVEITAQVGRAEVLKSQLDSVSNSNRRLQRDVAAFEERNAHLEKVNSILSRRLGAAVFALTGGEDE